MKTIEGFAIGMLLGYMMRHIGAVLDRRRLMKVLDRELGIMNSILKAQTKEELAEIRKEMGEV